MTNEVLIGRLYDIIDEVTRLGGEQERTSIVPGILVADASPSDLPTGYIKIVNPRDGTYVPCLTVNGLVVSDNDLVNVLFTKGTEPIALSQSAGSPSSSVKVSELWDSNFGAVAWQTNAAGHLSATGKDLTTTGDISANDITASGNILLTSGGAVVAGSGSSTPNLGAPASSFRWGNIYLASATFINALGSMDISTGAIGSEVRMIQLLNDVQDVLELGGIDGDDVDVNINNGQVFVEGSSGKVVIGSTTVLGALLQLSSATPSLYWEETDGAADNKIWQMNPSGESFGGFAVNDAVSASGQWLKVERTGTTIDSVSFPSADLDMSIKTSDVTYTFITATTSVSLLIDDEDAANRRTVVMRRISDTAARGSQNAFLRARLGPAAVQSGDIVGYFNFEAHDGTDYELGAQFRATVDGAVSANNTPMSFSILTSSGGLAALANRLHITAAGLVGVNNVTSPAAQLHVDQASTGAVIPVLYLDQGDVDQPFIEFATTIGTGNAIEAVGAKTLTPTHFVKVKLPGGLTRYFEVGTIA